MYHLNHLLTGYILKSSGKIHAITLGYLPVCDQLRDLKNADILCVFRLILRALIPDSHEISWGLDQLVRPLSVLVFLLIAPIYEGTRTV